MEKGGAAQEGHETFLWKFNGSGKQTKVSAKI
jgi:hypothetical protein